MELYEVEHFSLTPLTESALPIYIQNQERGASYRWVSV